MIDLSSIQSLSLDDLVGGAADTLPYAIYQTQMVVIGLREALAGEEKRLTNTKNVCLAELYARPEGVGKNEKERTINEQKALSADRSVHNMQNSRDVVARRLADAEAELSWAQDRFKATCTRSRVVAALLEYGGAMRLPLTVTADSQKTEVTSNDEMPF